jgi:hypothetical protein
MRSHPRIGVSLLGVIGVLGLVACHPTGTAELARPSDPVVLRGADLPRIGGVAPGEVVAFIRHDGGWRQIPVQVDERHQANLAVVHNRPAEDGVTFLVYSDPGTLTGADPNPSVDQDDEIVFMARDAGRRAPAGTPDPAEVLAGSGVEVTVADPLAGGARGYVYLFRRDPAGDLRPAAGHDYVDYDFRLLRGTYPEDYDFDGIAGSVVGDPRDRPPPNANPEDSTVTTPAYSTHFDDRWRNDELQITTSGATGVDILDRDKVWPFPGPDDPSPSPSPPAACVRTENTGAAGHGAFVTNVDGPVRAIRDYIGFNSGVYTERRHVFYERRQDVTTFLRVHSLDQGPDSVHDYTDAAMGMRYRNNLNPGGVIIDGVPDQVSLGQLTWEQVAGEQGTFTISRRTVFTEPGIRPTSFYADDATPDFVQCTGDGQAIGTSGVALQQPLSNSDPRRDPHFDITDYRTQYYDGPSQPLAEAQRRDAWARNPLTAASVRWTG